MHALYLNSKPGAFRVFLARKVDKTFKKFSERVLKRDGFTCQFCGFHAPEHQEVVNVDQNYYNNRLSNMATACCFCTQCFFIDAVGITDFGGGTLIYLPEIDQVHLNHFCHVLFCAIANNTAYKTAGQALYRSLKLRSQLIEQQFGDGMSEPSIMGQIMVESFADKTKMQRALQHVRLLPSRSYFKRQIAHWSETVLKEVSIELV